MNSPVSSPHSPPHCSLPTDNRHTHMIPPLIHRFFHHESPSVLIDNYIETSFGTLLPTLAAGSLCEYMVHLLYKWLNYYVCMSKTSPLCTPMSVFYAVFFANRTQHLTFSSSSDGRRRHVGGIASELRKHPKHGFKG